MTDAKTTSHSAGLDASIHDQSWAVAVGTTKKEGKFTATQLCEAFAKGDFLPTHRLWCTGMPKWERATNIPEIKDLLDNTARWLVADRGTNTSRGPYSDAAIAKQIVDGVLSDDAKLWRKGQPAGQRDWTRLNNIEELKPIVAAAQETRHASNPPALNDFDDEPPPVIPPTVMEFPIIPAVPITRASTPTSPTPQAPSATPSRQLEKVTPPTAQAQHKEPEPLADGDTSSVAAMFRCIRALYAGSKFQTNANQSLDRFQEIAKKAFARGDAHTENSVLRDMGSFILAAVDRALPGATQSAVNLALKFRLETHTDAFRKVALTGPDNSDANRAEGFIVNKKHTRSGYPRPA